MGDYYTKSGAPSTGASLLSSPVRSEFALIEAAFGKLPALTGNGSKFLRINSGGTAVEALSASDTLAALGTVFKMKSADESVTASTTLQNDDHLVASVLANSYYIFEIAIMVQQAAAVNMGFKWDLALPSGASLRYGGGVYSSSVGSINGTAGTPITSSVGTSTDVCLIEAIGVLVTAGTAGSIQLQWAQNTSDAGALTAKAGSYMSLTKLG